MSKMFVASFIKDLQNISRKYGFSLDYYNIVFHIISETQIDAKNVSSLVISDGNVEITMDKDDTDYGYTHYALGRACTFADLAEMCMRIKLSDKTALTFDNEYIENCGKRFADSIVNATKLMKELQDYFTRVQLEILHEEEHDWTSEYVRKTYNGYEKYFSEEFC